MVLRNTATEMGGGEDRSKWVAPVPDKKPGRENLHDLAAYRAYAKERGVDLTASKEKGPLDEEQERVRRLKQDAAQADAKSKQLRDSAKNAETQLNKSLLFQCVDSGSGRKVGNLLKDLVGGQKFDSVDHLENVVDYYCDSRSNHNIDTKFKKGPDVRAVTSFDIGGKQQNVLLEFITFTQETLGTPLKFVQLKR